MNVKLISLTQQQILSEKSISPEEIIVYCARVSNPENQTNFETAPKLIKYLIDHNHYSPFEMVDMTVEIQTSKAISAQILRHWSFSFQEFSARYSVVQALEHIEFRKQGKTNRQVGDEPIDDELFYEIVAEVEAHQANAVTLYKKLIEKGVAKECARMILPLNTQTTLYMKGSVRDWMFYLKLRTAKDTQKEHREVAEAIKVIFIEQFPNISEALGWIK